MKASLRAELPSMAAPREGHLSLPQLLTTGSRARDHTRQRRHTSPIILSPELFLGRRRPRTGSNCHGHVQDSTIMTKREARAASASS
eukprot:4808045-Pyramimonas_sp.AAC.1